MERRLRSTSPRFAGTPRLRRARAVALALAAVCLIGVLDFCPPADAAVDAAQQPMRPASDGRYYWPPPEQLQPGQQQYYWDGTQWVALPPPPPAAPAPAAPAPAAPAPAAPAPAAEQRVVPPQQQQPPAATGYAPQPTPTEPLQAAGHQTYRHAPPDGTATANHQQQQPAAAGGHGPPPTDAYAVPTTGGGGGGHQRWPTAVETPPPVTGVAGDLHWDDQMNRMKPPPRDEDLRSHRDESEDDSSWDEDELWEEDHLHPHASHAHDYDDVSETSDDDGRHSSRRSRRMNAEEGTRHGGDWNRQGGESPKQQAEGHKSTPHDGQHGAPQKRHHHHHPTAVGHPPFRRFAWFHDLLSHAHAAMCMILYALLGWKIVRENSSVGVSTQTMIAFAISETISCAIRVADFLRAGRFHWNLIYIDGLSTFLALWCLYLVWAKFNRSRDDNVDSFGMNIVNFLWLMMNGVAPTSGKADGGRTRRQAPMVWVQQQDRTSGTIMVDWQVLRQNNIHLGQLRPVGGFGKLISRVYWVIFYIFLVFPLAMVFIGIRRLVSPMRDVTAWLVAIGDAVRAVAMLPQFYMYRLKSDNRITEQLLILVVCETALKVIAVCYWASYGLFHYSFASSNLSRLYAIVVQVVNLAILSRVLAVLFGRGGPSAAIEKTGEMEIPLQDTAMLGDPSGHLKGTRVRTGISSRGHYGYMS